MTEINLENYSEPKMVTARDLQPGWLVLDIDGNWVEVQHVFDLEVPKQMFDVTVNGKKLRVSGGHLFYTVNENDLSTLRQFKKAAKKALKESTRENLTQTLEEVATVDESTQADSTLAEMLEYCGLEDNESARAVFTRIAEAIGHTEEVKAQGETVYILDARLFAQQVLALNGDKRWKVLPGKVRQVKDIEIGDVIE